MSMNEKENEILRLLFLYYRTNQKLSRKDASLLSKNKNVYLSESTIKRIETQNVKNNNSTLSKYANTLSLYFEKDDFPYNKLNSYKESIKESINNGSSLRDIETIHKELLNFQNLYKNYIYIGEISRILLSILEDFLLNKRINLKDQKMYEFITNSTNEKDDEIVVFMYYLLYKAYLFERGDNETNIAKIEDITSKINFKKIFYLDQTRFEEKNKNLISLYNKYREVYVTTRSNKNNNVSFIVTSLFNLAYCEILLNDYIEAEKHLIELLKIDSLDKFVPMYIIYDTHNFLGFIYFNLKQYNKAFDCFDIARKQDGNSIGFNFLLMFISLEKINKVNYSKVIIEEEARKVKLPAIKHLLEYYQLKYNCKDKKILEDYIVKYLNKKEVTFQFYSSLIYEELFNLVKETKHYKYLYDYLEISF